MIFSGLMSLCMSYFWWMASSPLVVSRHISRKFLSSMCVCMSIRFLSEQVPSSKSMYIVRLSLRYMLAWICITNCVSWKRCCVWI